MLMEYLGKTWHIYVGYVCVFVVSLWLICFTYDQNVKQMNTEMTEQILPEATPYVMKDGQLYRAEIIRNSQGEVLEVVYYK